MDTPMHPIVRPVPDLDVVFRLSTNEDGVQTVDVREGLGLVDPLVRLIDQVYQQRTADYLDCLTTVLQTLDGKLDPDSAASLARAITQALDCPPQHSDQRHATESDHCSDKRAC